ncbi:HECTD2 [Acanthosepion pharaonis]|uniref:HECTD2 n=1 Tax=Acanthosepion pharaonis TaxID=158019 RepID=A0A812C1Y4_ACAPH|nr:HECTD2 [Sepia pharaonis]
MCDSFNYNFNSTRHSIHSDNTYTLESTSMLSMDEIFKEIEKPSNLMHWIILYFWDVVLKFPVEFQKKLLLFITGSDHVPIGGTADMTFKITKVDNTSLCLCIKMVDHDLVNHLMDELILILSELHSALSLSLSLSLSLTHSLTHSHTTAHYINSFPSLL